MSRPIVSMLLRLATATVLGAGACADDAPTDVAPDSGPRVLAAERWNAVTRAVVGRREVGGGPARVARTFALVHVAQYNAVLAADAGRATAGRRAAAAGAAAHAAAAVLAGLYAAERDSLGRQLAADSATFSALPSARASDFAAGGAHGRAAAAAALARAAADRSDLAWTGTVPTGPGYWVGAPAPARPWTPRWGEARPWFLSSGDQFRPAPPPAYNSPAFLAALAEVRRASDTRTPEQLAVARTWGSVALGGPMGIWSEVALALAARDNLDERATTRLLALMHVATSDALIGCWDAKFAYWYIRPHEADRAITTPVGQPNFPAYPSAHSCISAASAGVLAGLFPDAAADLRARVVEAGEARIYGGLHFRFDVDAGQQLGASVAALVLARAPRLGTAVRVD